MTDKHTGLSAGTAVSFGVDATSPPYENENAAYFALATTSWPIMFFIAWRYTTTTNYLTEKDVIVPVHVREELGIRGKLQMEPSIAGSEATEKV